MCWTRKEGSTRALQGQEDKVGGDRLRSQGRRAAALEASYRRCDAMRCDARRGGMGWMERWPRRGVEMGDGDWTGTEMETEMETGTGTGTGTERRRRRRRRESAILSLMMLGVLVSSGGRIVPGKSPWGVEVTLESGAYGRVWGRTLPRPLSSSLNIEASCPLPGCADGGGSGGSGGGWWGLPKRRRSKRAGG